MSAKSFEQLCEEFYPNLHRRSPVYYFGEKVWNAALASVKSVVKELPDSEGFWWHPTNSFGWCAVEVTQESDNLFFFEFAGLERCYPCQPGCWVKIVQPKT